MILPSASLLGLVAASACLFASGADVDALLRRIDILQTANAALRTRLDACPNDEWIPTVGESWNYNLMTPVDTTVDADVVMIDMGECFVSHLNVGCSESCHTTVKGRL